MTCLDSPPGGNANGRFDPGEYGDLLIGLRNVGNQGVANTTALLRSGHALCRVTDSTAAWGAIPPDSVVHNTADPLSIDVDNSIPLETPVPMTLYIAGTDYVDTLSFTVTIGEIRSIDPIPDNAAPPRFWSYDDVDAGYSQRPEFSWVEINGIGTRLTLTDDQTVVVDLPTGFAWNYYGTPSSQISICGNGWVAPGYQTISTYTNTALPSSGMPGFVALCWDDLYPPTGNGVWYYHDAANHRFIVEYDSVAYYSNRTVLDKYQFILYDTTVHTPTGDNVFTVQYLTADGFSSSTVGIQDPSRSYAIQCLFDGAYHRGTARLEAGRAIKFVTIEPTTGIADEPRWQSAGNLRIRAFPNPFTGSTRLEASLARPGPLACRVYDNTGRVVRTLDSGRGTQSVTWNGRDDRGAAVAPGIYFYRFTAAEADAWGKLVLTR
ncbi:MAG: FlgD immunoglobulin-like domain containing protein [bacterium]